MVDVHSYSRHESETADVAIGSDGPLSVVAFPVSATEPLWARVTCSRPCRMCCRSEHNCPLDVRSVVLDREVCALHMARHMAQSGHNVASAVNLQSDTGSGLLGADYLGFMCSRLLERCPHRMSGVVVQLSDFSILQRGRRRSDYW